MEDLPTPCICSRVGQLSPAGSGIVDVVGNCDVMHEIDDQEHEQDEK